MPKSRTVTDLFGAKHRVSLLDTSEESEQISYMDWLGKVYPQVWAMAWHTPNGGKRHPRTAHTLRLLGTKRGIPDILVLFSVGAYRGLAVEFKRTGETWSAVSKEQRDWLARFEAAGWMATAAYGLDHAIKITEQYLRGEE